MKQRRSLDSFEQGKRITMAFRVDRDLRGRIEERCLNNGRSLMQEIELLLELGMAFQTLVALGQRALHLPE